MKYYSEEIVKKLTAYAEYNGTFGIHESLNIEKYPSIELPDKYGNLIDRDKLLDYHNYVYIDNGLTWELDYEAIKVSTILKAPVVVKGTS